MTSVDLSAATVPSLLERVRGRLAFEYNRYSDFLRFLYVQRVAGFTIRDTPEFEPECTPYFLERLAAAGSYLEFGTGASTMLAARRGVSFLAVESDPVFLNAVRRKVQSSNVYDERKQTYIHADIGVTEAWGAPLWRRQTGARLARWRAYPHAPWDRFAAMPSPHLILVDGRFRVACALAAAKFLRARDGEILFDDYANRSHYHVVERYLEVRRRVGRMVVLAPREDIDERALEADIGAYCRDWR